MVTHPHPILVRGALGDRPGPAILQRTDQDVIGALLAELVRPGCLASVAQTLAQETSGDQLKLYQPVHRVFHLVLLEVVCDSFGTGSPNPYQPRLDPNRIDSAGLVLRRYVGDPGDSGTDARSESVPVSEMPQALRFANRQLEGWRTLAQPPTANTTALRGWIRFNTSGDNPLAIPTDSDLTMDPDPQRRRPRLPLKTGQAELDRDLAQTSLMRLAAETLSEHTSPLFVAPPNVCEALGKTLLYGLIPLTSQEFSEIQNPEQAFPAEFVQQHLPPYLRSGSAAVPRPGQGLTGRQVAAIADPNENPSSSAEARLDYALIQAYVGFLRQLQGEFEAFSDRADARALYGLLNQIALPYADGGDSGTDRFANRPAGEALKEAAARLLDSQSSVPVAMPVGWPPLTASLSDQIAQQVKAILDRRLRASAPQEGRFDDLDRVYQICAFVRVKTEDGCPAKLHWSAPSPTFTLARWYDNSPVPPVQVALPDLLGKDRESALQTLKPNVTFAVPAGLFNALDGMTLQDLLDGKKPSGSGPALDWICGFNIPIITLCAFIVLNIFLQLLNFIFQWLLFIKICIPIPKLGGEE
ncbi:MAG: hypothetical protein KME14_18625 [Tildeniella torsiva UHER 1998/13D]|jgi:hypothetical protein|nr:hypothetical protein [Tildeniella torsiva UHER 1998/13D]